MCLAAAVCWMVVIFLYSAKSAAVSTQESTAVGTMVGRLFIPGFSGWNVQKQEAFAHFIDYPVRKTAHAAEYAVLGLLFAGSYVDSRKKRIRSIGILWMLGTAYAVSDELHQLFVPGRSCQVTDMMLDSCGVMLGVLAGQLLWARSKKAWRNTE